MSHAARRLALCALLAAAGPVLAPAVAGAQPVAPAVPGAPAAAGPPPAAQAFPGSGPALPRVLVIWLPEPEARALLARHPAAVGLGVYPPSRAARAFLDGIGASLAEATAPEPPPGEAEGLALMSLGTAGEAERAIARAPGARAIVLGAGRRTPVLVADLSGRGILSGGISRRPAVVVPGDLAASVLEALGARPRSAGFAGRPLRALPRADSLGEIRRLAARFERDGPQGVRLAVALAAIVIAGLTVALGALSAGVPAAAVRATQAIAFAPLGYLASLFAQAGSVWVRGLPLGAAVVLGAALPPRAGRRAAAGALLGLAAGIAVLAAIAWHRPGGEPALALWGDPLISWRFFGLRNQFVAFLAGGVIGGAALAGLPRAALLAAAGLAAFVAGAPTLGSNYVGVLWLAFGALVAVAAWRSGTARLRHLVVAALAGAAAIAVALAADAGSPITHGGRAARRISSGGLEALWGLVRGRTGLSIDEVRSFPAGIALAILVGAVLAALLARGLRSGGPGDARVRSGGTAPGDAPVRAASSGLAAAGLAALLTEDTGFYTATLLAFFALFAFVFESAGAARDGARPSRESG
ncbi:MAG: hypothetical protein HY775_12510 [Acidobacteria bacterium]|nr:hypothetical protein [Acidobacteriota bacterium]